MTHDIGWCAHDQSAHVRNPLCRNFVVIVPAYCYRCDTATHICPGCGTQIEHGQVACEECGKL
jgi:predicted amidophosphoribosyltransferase